MTNRMLRAIGAAAMGVMLAGALAAPALAQKTDLPDRKARQITPFDTTAMKEGNAALKANGSCTAQYIVGIDGKAKNITVDCMNAEMAPYVVKTIQTGVWEPEIFEHEFFDSFPFRQQFNYGTGGGVDPRGEKSPVLVDSVEPKDIERAINQLDKEGLCNIKYTVGADGKPKDIEPNCMPEAYNEKIIEAMAKMKFKPGEKGGVATDWPGMTMPITLSKPKG